jgi:hypothetical protein
MAKSLLTLLFNSKLHYGYVPSILVVAKSLEWNYRIMLMMLSFHCFVTKGSVQQSNTWSASLQCIHGSASTVWT